MVSNNYKMTTETLILKDKIIRNNDLELTFHKDYYWIYNEEPFPVVKYTLINCKNLVDVKFDSIDVYNDGVVIATRQEDNQVVFETTDVGDVKVKIVCDKIEIEERAYNSQDFVDLIGEILKQRDEEHDIATRFSNREDNLKQYLNQKLHTTTMKLNQAEWLSVDKKSFLQGQQDMLQKVIDILDKREI